jgi:endoglucanase
MAELPVSKPLGGERFALWCLAVLPIAVVAPTSQVMGQLGNNQVAAKVRVNSVGFLPDHEKLATVAGTAGSEFVVTNPKSGSQEFHGRLSAIGSTTDDDQPLALADFTRLSREGQFRIEVDGAAQSPDFRIAKDALNWPFHCAFRAMYLWRCGTEVSANFAGVTYRQRPCHLQDAYLDYVGGPAAERKDGCGGWHDAGDYNKYTVNGAFTVGMMLQAWEHFPERLTALNLNIPESGNDVPDFLDELRWELEWLLKMQADDGRVYHKLSTLKFGGFVMPEKETAKRFFTPWSTAATADFVAVMAHAARAFRPVDEAFSQRCLKAAEKSYAVLDKHPDNHRPDLSAFETGPYDSPDGDDRIWAAAELWETTGNAKYLHDFEKRLGSSRKSDADSTESAPVVDADWDWANLRNLGIFTYLSSARPGRDATTVAWIRKDALRTADSIIDNIRRHPYGRPLGDTYYWGCNGTAVRQTMNLNVAHRLTHERKYRAAMLHAIHHVFGRNPYGRSYVTGLGHRPPMFPTIGAAAATPWPPHGRGTW